MTTVQQAGKKGGSVKSEAKSKAARANASKPRGKWVTAIHAEWADKDGNGHSALVLVRGKIGEHNPQDLLDEVEKHPIAIKFPVAELWTITATSERIVL